MTTTTYTHLIVTPDLSEVDWTAPATDVYDEVYDLFVTANASWLDHLPTDDEDRVMLAIQHRVDRLVTANLV